MTRGGGGRCWLANTLQSIVHFLLAFLILYCTAVFSVQYGGVLGLPKYLNTWASSNCCSPMWKRIVSAACVCSIPRNLRVRVWCCWHSLLARWRVSWVSCAWAIERPQSGQSTRSLSPLKARVQRGCLVRKCFLRSLWRRAPPGHRHLIRFFSCPLQPLRIFNVPMQTCAKLSGMLRSPTFSGWGHSLQVSFKTVKNTPPTLNSSQQQNAAMIPRSQPWWWSWSMSTLKDQNSTINHSNSLKALVGGGLATSAV